MTRPRLSATRVAAAPQQRQPHPRPTPPTLQYGADGYYIETQGRRGQAVTLRRTVSGHIEFSYRGLGGVWAPANPEWFTEQSGDSINSSASRAAYAALCAVSPSRRAARVVETRTRDGRPVWLRCVAPGSVHYSYNGRTWSSVFTGWFTTEHEDVISTPETRQLYAELCALTLSDFL